VVILAVALAAATVVAVTRGDDDAGAQLNALKADPMAHYVPPQSRLAKTVAVSDRGGGAFTKQQTAKYTRLFSLSSPRPELALEDAVAAAATAGWMVSEAIAGVAATGRRRLKTGPATLAISLTRTAGGLPEGVEAPAISVTLVHVRV